MKENSKEVILEFALPEFKKDDIKIKFTENAVSVQAGRKIEKETQRKDFFHQEKTERSFNYTTTVPSINPSKAKIFFKGGILKISVPKKQFLAKSKKLL